MCQTYNTLYITVIYDMCSDILHTYIYYYVTCYMITREGYLTCYVVYYIERYKVLLYALLYIHAL